MLRDGLVLAEVDEGAAAAVGEGRRLADAEAGGHVAGGDPGLADRVLGGRRAEAAVGIGHGGAVAGGVDAVQAADRHPLVDRDPPALVELDVERP